jgi:arabinoxylan arabinofuranohydrolase
LKKMTENNRRDFVKRSLAAAVGMGLSARVVHALPVKVKDSMPPASRGSDLPSRGNPIVPGIGVCDPQVRIFDDQIYLYATHDYSPENKGYRMQNWWVWRTDDLVHWEQVSVLKPEQTFLARPFEECWATDAGMRNGQFYFYFSAGPKQIGVVTGETPAGPWRDPLGKPLIPEGLTPTQERDPGILMDDDGTNYIIFGTWNYYIARLNDDMISLAEPPRLVELDHKIGPYGEGKTDDKPFLHKRAGMYYLSWGCFYAMAKSPYGPYIYKGSVVTPESTAPEFRTSTLLLDRHGSFFPYNGQWYFACNDYSEKGSSPYFRNCIFSYLHYRDNGEMAPVRIDKIGVGRYDAKCDCIEAEDYFKLTGGLVCECPSGGFEVRGLRDRSVVLYPNVENVPPHAKLILHFSSEGGSRARVEIRDRSSEGKLLGHRSISSTRTWDNYVDLEVPLTSTSPTVDLAFVFRGKPGELVRLNSWKIVDAGRV